MIDTGSRLRQIGWIAALAGALALFALLSFQVQTVRSEVRLAERTIIALERETVMLETEFQPRASQRQLAEWNVVEFGYRAPRADQFFDHERQLASLGVPAGPNAPQPIRVARADVAQSDRAMVSPVTGAPVTLAFSPEEDLDCAIYIGAIMAETAAEMTPESRLALTSAYFYFIGRYEAQRGQDLTRALEQRYAAIGQSDPQAIEQTCSVRARGFAARVEEAGRAIARSAAEN